jgi:hypothetical protein
MFRVVVWALRLAQSLIDKTKDRKHDRSGTYASMEVIQTGFLAARLR